MPRADFYLIARPRFRDEPLRLVCELARRCHDSGEGTLVLARDAAQAEALDDLLWAFDEEAYVAHQIAGTDEDERYANPDASCKASPASSASVRCWRHASQTSAAPCSAHAADVQRASSASGTATVENATPRASSASASTRSSSRFVRRR